MESQTTIQTIREVGLREAQNNNAPPEIYTRLAIEKAISLAKKMKGDEQIVETALWLCDLRIGPCLRENRVQDHVKESLVAAREVLSDAGASKEFAEKSLQVMSEHHAKVHKYLEGEIVANADAYKFLPPIGSLHLLWIEGKRSDSFSKSLSYVFHKIEEKWNVLTIQECKDEMRESYEHLKFVFESALEKESKLNFKVN
ncbi:MAG: hypothetical protein V1722_00565 [Candidatus Micrarchaeota archaeon]